MSIKQKIRSCLGTTLLEVLIAVLIIGIGLLGIASLQIASLQGSNDAHFRSRATDLAASLADRLRANLIADDSYQLAVAADCDTPPNNICAMAPDAPPVVSGFPTCTPEQMATYDLWEIQCVNGVVDALPGGAMLVTCDNGTLADPCPDNTTFQIAVTWQMQSSVNGIIETQQVGLVVVPGIQP